MIATSPRPRGLSFADAVECEISEELARSLAEQVTQRVLLSIAGRAITVHFSLPQAALLFRQRYADMLRDGAVHAPHVLQFYACERGGDVFLWSRAARAWHVKLGSIEAHLVAFFADNALMMELIERLHLVSIHAAVLGHGERAFALLGVSTAGKSTTAVACAEFGLDFYSDERCLLEDGYVKPFPRALALRAMGRRRLLVDEGIRSEYMLATMRAADAEEELIIAPSHFVPRSATKPARLRALFVIAGYAAVPCVLRAEFLDALPELMLGMSMRERGLDRMARAMRELQNTPVFRIELGSPSATARMITRIFADVG